MKPSIGFPTIILKFHTSQSAITTLVALDPRYAIFEHFNNDFRRRKSQRLSSSILQTLERRIFDKDVLDNSRKILVIIERRETFFNSLRGQPQQTHLVLRYL